MTYAVAVNSSGQATIPKDIRDFLGIIPGENRLTLEIVKGKVILGKEKSAKEQLLASIEKIRASNEAEMKRNPAYREAHEKYKGMTYDEFIEAYENTPEGKKEFKEKYGIDI